MPKCSQAIQYRVWWVFSSQDNSLITQAVTKHGFYLIKSTHPAFSNNHEPINRERMPVVLSGRSFLQAHHSPAATVSKLGLGHICFQGNSHMRKFNLRKSFSCTVLKKLMTAFHSLCSLLKAYDQIIQGLFCYFMAKKQDGLLFFYYSELAGRF